MMHELGARIDPFKNFPISFSKRQLLFQSGGVDSDKAQELLIKGTIEVEFSDFPGKGRPAFIEHPGQNNVTAKTGSGASRRSQRKVCD
jgi:hypothetical protein